MEKMNVDHSDIIGWGADLDRANRPAVPKERMPPRLEGVHWVRPEAQPEHMTIFTSLEYPERPPLFGTSSPPKGLSGLMRGFAFKFSENDLRHWLILLFADRVNMVEGIFEDLMKGHIPNFFAEAGWKGEFKHNPKAVVTRAVIYTALAGGLIYYLTRDRRKMVS